MPPPLHTRLVSKCLNRQSLPVPRVMFSIFLLASFIQASLSLLTLVLAFPLYIFVLCLFEASILPLCRFSLYNKPFLAVCGRFHKYPRSALSTPPPIFVFLKLSYWEFPPRLNIYSLLSRLTLGPFTIDNVLLRAIYGTTKYIYTQPLLERRSNEYIKIHVLEKPAFFISARRYDVRSTSYRSWTLKTCYLRFSWTSPLDPLGI
jgi:hypothetical protein